MNYTKKNIAIPLMTTRAKPDAAVQSMFWRLHGQWQRMSVLKQQEAELHRQMSNVHTQMDQLHTSMSKV